MVPFNIIVTQCCTAGSLKRCSDKHFTRWIFKMFFLRIFRLTTSFLNQHVDMYTNFSEFSVVGQYEMKILETVFSRTISIVTFTTTFMIIPSVFMEIPRRFTTPKSSLVKSWSKRRTKNLKDTVLIKLFNTWEKAKITNHLRLHFVFNCKNQLSG